MEVFLNTKHFNKDDYAIAKIKLQSKGKLKLWNDKLKDLKDKKTKLYLLVDAHTDNSDLEIEYHGRNPPLFKSTYPTPEATPKQNTERRQYWKDEDYYGESFSKWY